MSHPIGSEERPLRVAVVGAGPSGFYAAAALLKQKVFSARVDLLDRLPMPYGLVRGGVAPDHQNIKSVIRAYQKTASGSGFRFFGNVRIGVDVPVETLRAHYDQVVFAIGCESDRRLRIPGEDLDGSHSATEFVGWYNGHPDFQDRTFDLSGVERVVVVGVGNVAMDVTRILVRDPDELAGTDITDTALEALRRSALREVVILGRRGPAEASFSPAEIKEIGELAGVEVVVSPEDAAVDDLSRAWLERADPKDARVAQKNLDYLAERAAAGATGAGRTVRVRFCVSPVEILGEDHVQGLRIEKNELTPSDDGRPWPHGTGQTEEIACQLVFRAVGYQGIQLSGLPFDRRTGTIPNVEGRVVDPESTAPLPGLYVVGWAKRGPTGLIGTNRTDAQATVDHMLEDISGHSDDPREDPAAMLRAHQPELVTFEDWERLDALEVARGQERGKIRLKFTSVAAALAALRE